jgi:hypothetical protein
MPDDIQSAVAASVFGDEITDEMVSKPVLYGELFPLTSDPVAVDDMPRPRLLNLDDVKTVSPPFACPKCGSTNVLMGAIVLGCNTCGWNHHADHPCDVCGKPSTGSCGANGQSYHGCAEHPAFERFKEMLGGLHGTGEKQDQPGGVVNADGVRISTDDETRFRAVLTDAGCPSDRIDALWTCVSKLRAAGYDASVDGEGGITIDNSLTKLPLDAAERIIGEFEANLGGLEREYQRVGLPSLKLKAIERLLNKAKYRADAPHRARRPTPITGSAVPSGRNTKCPCGSGLKFKKCHGRAKR